MKKKVLMSFLMLVCIFSSSCEPKDELSTVNLLSETDTITDLVTSTSWRVSLFTNGSLDETVNFNGYSFAFNADGSLFADSTTDSVEGTWEILETSSDTTDATGTNTTSENDIDETIVVDNSNDANENAPSDDNSADSENVETTGEDNGSAETVNNDNSENDQGNEDNNGNDNACNNCANQQLFDILTGCSDWFVDKLERNDEDLDDSLVNYRFDFLEDGTLTAKAGSNSYSGSWEISGNDGNTMMTVNVPTLDEVNDTWNLHEIELENDERKVDLRIGGEDRLRFKNRCSTLGDKTFANANKVGNGLIFRIFFANAPNFNELSRDWEIVTRTDLKIELVYIDNEGGIINQLEFERN